MNKCQTCKAGEKGYAGLGKEVECVASIETMMGCGCGGYVQHSVHHCTRCGRYFLAAYEDHWPPSSADAYMFEIDRAEAEPTLAQPSECHNIDDRHCGCPAHRESELLHRETRGQRRYFEATEQHWDS